MLVGPLSLLLLLLWGGEAIRYHHTQSQVWSRATSLSRAATEDFAPWSQAAEAVHIDNLPFALQGGPALMDSSSLGAYFSMYEPRWPTGTRQVIGILPDTLQLPEPRMRSRPTGLSIRIVLPQVPHE